MSETTLRLRVTMESTASITFDPFTLYKSSDPYSEYRRLRNRAPVHHLEQADIWVVTRYEDCIELIRDADGFSSRLGMRMAFGDSRRREHLGGDVQDNPFETMGADDLRILIAIDPPEHVRLRRLLSRPFTPREIGIHENWIRPLCEERFKELLQANVEGRADWVRDFTWPFPVLVIGELMGIPASMRNDFKRWSDDLIGIFVGGPNISDQKTASLVEMVSFFDKTILRRRSEPGEDLISKLVHKTELDDEPLTAEELVMFCVLLLVAGNETTTNLLSNAAKVFAEDPRILEDIRADPKLIASTVEEALRYDAPVQAIPRGTTRAIELGETKIPKDALLLAYLGSANRDERHYEAPEQIRRTSESDRSPRIWEWDSPLPRSATSRLEAQVAVEALSRNVRAIELTSPPVATGGLLLRGASSMEVHLHEV